MNDYDYDDEPDLDAMTEEEYAQYNRQFRATPMALREGYLVEVDGEVLVTPKGLAEIRRGMEAAGVIPKRH